MSFSSAKFTMDLFSMSHGVPITKRDTSTMESKHFAVGADHTIEIPYQTKEGSIRIKGFTELEGDTPEAGKFIVEHGTDSTAKTVITFDEDDCAIGDKMRVAYRRRVNSASVTTVQTSNRTATGSLAVHWPVYSDGSDVAESSVKGWLHMELPKVRVTAFPGFETSYKTAATNSITFSAIDPKEANEQMYTLTYEPLDVQGQIVTTPSQGATEW